MKNPEICLIRRVVLHVPHSHYEIFSAEGLPDKFDHDPKGEYYEAIPYNPKLEEVIREWRDSPPHNAILLSRDIKKAAPSIYKYNGHYYCVFRSM